MLITRKTKVPLHWVFYAQLPFVMFIMGSFATGAPFLFAMKKFIDNPAAITFLLSIEVFVTTLGGPFCNWLSDRVWTRFGRRKPFILVANILQAAALFAMPFASSLLSLIVLRWCYGIAQDIGSPNQALTMEVVPAKQRGMGAGFFHGQIQIVNLFFWGIVLGRFDDVFFSGPFENLFSVSGETLIFFAGGIVLVSVSIFTWFGIHEVEPPTRRRIRDDRRPGESLFRLFLRGFFGEVLHKSLLPLYLLLMAGTLLTVGLGTLEPLLYTEQWGYSLQEMGTNTAIGASIGIVTAMFAGWLADRTSKLKVYATAMILGLLGRVFWTVFVYQKPDYRPELHEILFFGTVQSVFGLIASAASFPLILEYVERNRLGTAGAGMGFFNSTIKNSFGMFVGFYLVLWSIFFLPQAGDRVQVVFQDEPALAEVRSRVAAGGLDPEKLDFEALHRPGVDGETSRHWAIRRPVDEAGDLHKRLKDLGNKIAKTQLKLQRPKLAPETTAKLQAELEALRAEDAATRERLAASTAEFESRLTRALGPALVPAGGELLDARISEDGAEIALTLDFVEPVAADISRRTLFEALTFRGRVPGRHTVPGELRRFLESVDLARAPDPETGELVPRLAVTPLPAPANALRIELHRDPDFVALESALVAAGRPWTEAYAFVSGIIPPIRGVSRADTAAYTISQVALDTSAENPRLAFDLAFENDSAPDIEAPELRTVFATSGGVRDARVGGAGSRFRVELELAPFSPAPGDTSPADAALAARLRELRPEIGAVEHATLSALVARITQIASTGPVFLTAVRPVPVARPADRQYDFFFSMQVFMILTDILGLLILALIIQLEKRGVIRRVGALEDAQR